MKGFKMQGVMKTNRNILYYFLMFKCLNSSKFGLETMLQFFILKVLQQKFDIFPFWNQNYLLKWMQIWKMLVNERSIYICLEIWIT